ncbi:MAG: sulfotransferase [Pirellulales bacterium]|nr:sulfotransferase [Pirellulales bacterium]
MADSPKKKPDGPKGGYKDRFWIPRFWDGMGTKAWFSLLARNRFAVTPRRVAMAVIVSDLALMNGGLWALQELLHGRRIRNARIEHQPIFIIGHWRSGTTLLHEMLVLDERHSYPDTYACFAPNHFLLTGRVIPRMLQCLMPSQRPMDNMKLGWDRPQEDEFALCNMGLPSPYLTLAFPNRPPQDPEYLDLQDVPPEQLARWKRQFEWFLKCLTLRRPGRIVLKSPAHTCRIEALLDIFPDARFVHIIRDPYVVFPSTVHLWKRLYRDQGFQVPDYRGLNDHVFETFTRMYDVFERQRDLIAPNRFCEVRYEDLIREPVDQIHRVYDTLELGGFDAARPALEKHAAGMAGYKTNRYDLDGDLRDEITRRWAGFIEKYGYETPS